MIKYTKIDNFSNKICKKKKRQTYVIKYVRIENLNNKIPGKNLGK